MRVIVVTAIALAIIGLLAMPLTTALFDVGFIGGPVNIGAPYVVGPGFTFASPFAQSGGFMQAFNRSTLAQNAAGALAVSFPSIPGGGISPLIGQTTSRSIVATKTYFFNDFLSAV